MLASASQRAPVLSSWLCRPNWYRRVEPPGPTQFKFANILLWPQGCPREGVRDTKKGLRGASALGGITLIVDTRGRGLDVIKKGSGDGDVFIFVCRDVGDIGGVGDVGVVPLVSDINGDLDPQQRPLPAPGVIAFARSGSGMSSEIGMPASPAAARLNL